MRAEAPAPGRAPSTEREYAAIRSGAGLTDATRHGRLRVGGPGARELLDGLVAGNLDRLPEQGIRWTAMLDDAGRVVADVHVWNDFDRYLVTCSRARLAAVRSLLETSAGARTEVEDVTGEMAAVAVEGPDAGDLPAAILGPEAGGLALLRFVACRLDGAELTVARLGATGEFGYLFLAEPRDVGALVARIREALPGAAACGEAVQDLLRLEVRSFNQDLDLLRGETALEAGLHWMIDFRKPAFRGREAVLAEKRRGPRRGLVAFEARGADVPDRGAAVHDLDRPVGYVANAAFSPGLGRAIGLAYLDAPFACVGLALRAEGAGPITTASSPLLVTESARAAAR